MDLPDWVYQLWSELRFRELAGQEVGEGFQRLFQQVMKAVYGDDFVDVRPVGKHGDFTCDGWGMRSRTCYAVYAPFTRKTPGQVRAKIARDLHGGMRAWPEIRGWRLVHNDHAGLSALVAAAIVSLKDEMDAGARRVTILPPWGPKDLWELLRDAPDEARVSVLGSHVWRLDRDPTAGFARVNDDPVSVSAGRSVAQLLDGFAAGGVLEPLAATTFGEALAAFLLGDETTFKEQAAKLEQRCRDDPFEAMLTSVVFCVKAVQLWEAATGEKPELWAEKLAACGATVPYITQIVTSARLGTATSEPLPGHPDDQRKVTMNLGRVTAATLQLTAEYRTASLVSVLQDLLIGVQREPLELRESSPDAGKMSRVRRSGMTQSDCYVYLLVDTTDLNGPGQGALYVGKGTGARFLDHFDEAEFVKAELEAAAEALRAGAEADDAAASEVAQQTASRDALLPKADKIAMLQKRPGTVRVDILRRDLTEHEALLVESAAIDLLGVGNLTNDVRGHHPQRQPLKAFLLQAAARDVPLTDVAVIVPVSGMWAPGDRLEGLSSLDEAAVWENARHYWAVASDVRDIIRRLARSAEAVRLLAVHTANLEDGTRTVLGSIVMGEWLLEDTHDTARGVEFRRSSAACPRRYLHHRLLASDGVTSVRTQQGVRYSDALAAMRHKSRDS